MTKTKTKTKTKRTQVQVLMPRELADTLSELAADCDTTRSALIAQVMAQWMRTTTWVDRMRAKTK